MSTSYLLIGGPSTGTIVDVLPPGYESTGRPSSGAGGGSCIVAEWTDYGFSQIASEVIAASTHLDDLFEARGIPQDGRTIAVNLNDTELMAAIERVQEANRKLTEWLDRHVQIARGD